MLIGADIVVVGAGVAGLATATALARFGASVRVLEQAPAITEVGAGLQISPNGLAVLRALGADRALVSASSRADAIVLRDYRRGRQVLRLDLREHAADLTFVLAHRGDLVAALEAEAHHAGVQILTGRSVAAVEPGPRPRLVTADGGRIETDILIGADGLRSVARGALGQGGAARFTGQIAWRALVEARPGELPEGGAQVQVHMGPGRHFVHYPLRHGRLINIVAVEERPDWTEEGWHIDGDPADLALAFRGFAPEVRTLIARVGALRKWGLFRRPVAEVWGRDNVALVGDAAHPTLPFLAQGANMALEDAWVLCRHLAVAEPAAAFAAYAAERRGRVARLIEAANANARNYHLRNPLLRGGAQGALALAGRVMPAMTLRQFDWIWRHDVTV